MIKPSKGSSMKCKTRLPRKRGKRLQDNNSINGFIAHRHEEARQMQFGRSDKSHQLQYNVQDVGGYKDALYI